MRAYARLGAALGALFLGLSGCGSGQPSPSSAPPDYRGKLRDDTMVEASTTVLVTKRTAVMAVDCRPLAAAVRSGDEAAIDRAVRAGTAARLPAHVTIYTPPFGPQNPQASPFVVTDDKHAGILCTPDAFDVVKS